MHRGTTLGSCSATRTHKHLPMWKLRLREFKITCPRIHSCLAMVVGGFRAPEQELGHLCGLYGLSVILQIWEILNLLAASYQ